MKWYQRIFVRMRRKPIYDFLLLIFSVFSLFCMLGIDFVKQSTESIENNIYEKMGTVATLQGTTNSINFNGLYPEKNYKEIYNDYLTLIRKCSKRDEVSYSDYSLYMDYISYSNIWDNGQLENTHQMGSMLVGIEQSEFQEYHTEGLEIVEGRLINCQSSNNEAIIPAHYKYSDGKEIKIGDILTLYYDDYYSNLHINNEIQGEYKYPKLEIRVVGKYQTDKDKKDEDRFLRYQHRIYVQNQVVQNYSDLIIHQLLELNVDVFNEDNRVENFNYDYFLPCGIFAPYFELKSYLELTSFEEYCKSQLQSMPTISAIYSFSSTSDSIWRILKPLEKLNQTIHVIQWILFGAIVLLILLFVMYFIHQRKDEMLLYQILGEQKKHIIMQILGEFGFICFIAISGYVLTQKPAVEWINHQMISSIKIEKEILTPDEEFKEKEEYLFSGEYLLNPQNIKKDELISYKDEVVPLHIHIKNSVILVIMFCLSALFTSKLILKKKN